MKNTRNDQIKFRARYSRLPPLLCLLSLALWMSSARAEVWSYTAPCASNAFFSAAQGRLALGYRAISLSSASNRIAAVWLQDYAPAQLQMFVPYSGLQSNSLVMKALGYRPVCVAIFGQIPNESYLVSYLNDGKASSLFARLDEAHLKALTAETPGSRVITPTAKKRCSPIFGLCAAGNSTTHVSASACVAKASSRTRCLKCSTSPAEKPASRIPGPSCPLQAFAGPKGHNWHWTSESVFARFVIPIRLRLECL